MISKNFDSASYFKIEKEGINKSTQTSQNPKTPKDMNTLFIYLIVPSAVILTSSLFQSKLNKPQLLKQLYSLYLASLTLLSKIKVAKSIDIFNKQSQFIYLDHKFPQRLVRR